MGPQHKRVYARLPTRYARGRQLYELIRFRCHSPFTLASWMTLRHFGSSDLMYFASCSGVPAIDSKYWRSRKFFLTSGSANVLRTSALILATMSAGMPGGPNSPNHDTAS